MALAHDWLCGFRGGEAVLDRIARLPGLDISALYVMFDDGRPLTPAIDRLTKRVSMIGKLPFASGPLRRVMLPIYPTAVEQLARMLDADHRREPIDLLISTSSAAIKGLRPPRRVPHLCYCHSPARYVWSQREEYARTSLITSVGLRLFAIGFRAWDSQTSANVTRFIANSAHTARQIKAFYQREADVIHPPVRTDFFTPGSKSRAEEARRESFWLVVTALEPYKRVDLAIEAAKAAGNPLVIAGDGSQRKTLEKLSDPRLISFLGRVTDDKLRDLYRSARLLLFPQVEDFGIVAVEAQACGLPVVARRAGGAVETVIDGITGAFFDEPDVKNVLRAAARCPEGDDVRCRENARKFSESRFDLTTMDLIQACVGQANSSG